MRIIVTAEDSGKSKIAGKATENKSTLSIKPKQQVNAKSVNVDSVQTQANDNATENGAEVLHAIKHLKIQVASSTRVKTDLNNVKSDLNKLK